MTITFKHVMPKPLSDVKHNKNSIWGSEFTLKKGNKILLNASSGKGKTTFTHLLAGIRSDYSGSIIYEKEDISTFTPYSWANLRMNHLAFIFQDLQLFPKLTVKENLLLKNQLTSTYTELELKELLEKLEVLDKWNTPCQLLSMGQQQRVAIVRALAQPFQWLIMDEPFSHLDEENIQRCLNLINERCETLKAGFVLTSLGSYHKITYDKELNL